MWSRMQVCTSEPITLNVSGVRAVDVWPPFSSLRVLDERRRASRIGFCRSDANA